MKFFSSALLLGLTLLGFSGCGYHLQKTSNPWGGAHVEKVYIEPVVNNTLRSGYDSIFYNALTKEFLKGKRVKLVNKRGDADASLVAVLDSVGSSGVSSNTVPNIAPGNENAKQLADMTVAAEYAVSASLQVSLSRLTDGKVLWSQSFARSKIYPAGNRFGAQGTTSVLINHSLEEITLQDLAQFIASDAYDTMLEAF